MAVSAQSAKEMRTFLDAHIQSNQPQGAPAAPVNFCSAWGAAKPVLQLLAGLLNMIHIPGIPGGAGTILTALIVAGDEVYKHTCSAAGG